MKKLFFLLALMVVTMMPAQTLRIVNGVGNFKSAANHAVQDTITNAVTKYQYAIIDGYNDIVVVQPTFTKVSGTASASVKLQGSVNGVSYNDIGSAYTVTDVATQSTAFIVTPSNYKYYRLSIVPTGTQSLRVTTPVLVRNK